MLTGWVLAVVLAMASAPLYSGYAALDSRPGGISALSDQPRQSAYWASSSWRQE
jgi:hypothetical protein